MGIRSKFFDTLGSIGSCVLSVIPTKKTTWVFGAWKGQLYSDNARYLYEYVLEKHPEINAVWITRNQSVCDELKKKGMPVQKRFSLKGIWSIARAGVAFETEGDQDISPFMNYRTKVVEMWHGGVSPKRLNWKGFNSGKMGVRRKKSFWMTSSQQNSELLMEEFGLENSHTIITGYPRNDVFVQKSESNPVIEELEKLVPGSRKVIYMPTHRNFGKEVKTFSIEEMVELDKKLKELNVVMLFKPHFHELNNYLQYKEMFTNIVLAKDQIKYGDVYSYIGGFDLLISDYSSIMYDFLCTGKSVVMFPYDIENYKANDAGLFEFYDQYPVGPVCYTWEEVVGSIQKLLFEKNNEWSEKTEAARKIFHPYNDGKNCERVYDATMQLLEKK